MGIRHSQGRRCSCGPSPDARRPPRPCGADRLRTYTCINCLRTLPYLKGLYATYHPYGLQIVGVHTPEFTFEQDAGDVGQAVLSNGLRYPVAQDNRYGTWNAWGNQYWPAEYLIDPSGRVRHTKFGEGDYAVGEQTVRSLLIAAGVRRLPPPMSAHAQLPAAQLATPETTSIWRAPRASPSRHGRGPSITRA